MRNKLPKKVVVPVDPKYGSLTIAKLINRVMLDGEKAVARTIVYSAIELAATELGLEPMKFFDEALKKVKPRIEVRAKRVGGANYQVPTPVRESRQEFLAIKWIVEGARAKRKNTSFDLVLKQELLDAYKGEGSAVEKMNNVIKQAEANRAFAHLAW